MWTMFINFKFIEFAEKVLYHDICRYQGMRLLISQYAIVILPFLMSMSLLMG